MYLNVQYRKPDGTRLSELVIEGFGPETIIGAVRDLLDPEHRGPNDSQVAGITIKPDGPPSWSDGKPVVGPGSV